MLVSLTADLEAIFVQKAEAAARGVQSSGVDMYAQYGGFGAVVDKYYRPIAQNLITPVLGWSDVVLSMGGKPHHRVECVEWYPGRWRAHQAGQQLEELPVVVVGGGQAGLCASYHLQREGIAHTVLEKHATVGSAWERERWDSFRLVTENQLCALPGFPCTAIGHDPHGFMPKMEVVRYLQEFATRHELPVRLNTGVRRVTRAWDGWNVQLDVEASAWLRCKQVVLAIGGFHVPKTPTWHTQLPSTVAQLQSRDYKNPKQLPEGSVVVVGSAQSGAQIAAELAEAGREVSFCGHS